MRQLSHTLSLAAVNKQEKAVSKVGTEAGRHCVEAHERSRLFRLSRLARYSPPLRGSNVDHSLARRAFFLAALSLPSRAYVLPDASLRAICRPPQILRCADRVDREEEAEEVLLQVSDSHLAVCFPRREWEIVLAQLRSTYSRPAGRLPKVQK